MFTTRHSHSDSTAQSLAYHGDARAERLFHEHKKLLSRARNYAVSHPKIVILGEDPLVDHFLASAGFGPVDVGVLRLHAQGRMVTALCVPTRLWRNPEAKSRLIEIKAIARKARTSCILVPQRWLKADIRSSVSRLIAQSSRTKYTRTQFKAIMDHLHEVRISTLLETAGTIEGHDDPVAVVLAMAAHGYVELDRSAPLRGDTWTSTRL